MLQLEGGNIQTHEIDKIYSAYLEDRQPNYQKAKELLLKQQVVAD